MPGERYRRGAHTVLELKYHFVWKTKYAYCVLKGDVGLRLRALIRQVCEEQQMSVLQGNIRPDHVHLLVSAPSWLSPLPMSWLKPEEAFMPLFLRRIFIRVGSDGFSLNRFLSE